MKTLEFYFDLGSPTAYLAWCRLQQLSAQYDFELLYRPVLLGGVFKATANASPVTVPAKGAYMMQQDLPRFAHKYQVALNSNPHFPVNTLQLMRGACAALEQGQLEPYLQALFPAMWVDAKNLGDPELVADVLGAAGMDAAALMAAAQDPVVKQALIEATEAAVARGIFGVPTVFLGDDMYFGQDRLDFVEEALRG